ncbi:MAG: hypothetical protein D8M58_10395 [Calditrichaeota bacterium]|nr:MAG: hypothetical protein DWQ03_09770 [Calditrichota bacterium]MBL1205799.1 hypothetical protein [Calditrichota bacterium]NOG45627.1 SnoaL-like domain-containing protein [Calditrichota bacterium]
MTKTAGTFLSAVLLLFCCTAEVDLSNKKDFISTLEKHLKAVSDRDIEALNRTLSKQDDIYLILPSSTPSKSNSGFIKMHTEWFQDASWTFETKILHAEVEENIGFALVEVMYKEPDRNGKPYFNKMAVSYVLKRIDGHWFVIMDHASSIEKTKP